MSKDGRVSIKRVAEAAGVATGTVPKAFNGDRETSEVTRVRVRIARELGYRPAAQARGLAGGRTGNVAVRSMFRPVSSSAFYSEVLAGAAAELEKHDLNLPLTSLKRGDDLLRLASKRRADGVLYIGYDVIGYDVEAAFLRRLHASILLVVVDGEAEGISVVSDNLAGNRAATRHLLSRGRRLAFAAGTLAQPNFRTRRQGFIEVLLGDYRPDGVVYVNDTVGYLVLQALETLAVRVPEDVAVVGYDGTAGAETRKARLSTVAVDKRGLGAAGMRLLLGRVTHPEGPPPQVVVPTRLEPGDTS